MKSIIKVEHVHISDNCRICFVTKISYIIIRNITFNLQEINLSKSISFLELNCFSGEISNTKINMSIMPGKINWAIE